MAKHWRQWEKETGVGVEGGRGQKSRSGRRRQLDGHYSTAVPSKDWSPSMSITGRKPWLLFCLLEILLLLPIQPLVVSTIDICI